MSEGSENLSRIQDQFRRQSEAYSKMAVVTDPKLLEQIASLAGAGARALDVACVPGFVAMALAARFGAVAGIDATDRLIARARTEASARGIGNVAFAMADVGRMPLRSDSFDAVACRFAFHHFSNPRGVLAEMKRVCRPGGRIVIVDMTTAEDAARADYHNRLERLCDPTHARALPISEWEAMFAEADLRVAAKAGRESSYELDAWMEHGGPPPERRAQIVAMMEASLATDRCGLKVRREHGALHFSHAGVTWTLEKPAA